MCICYNLQSYMLNSYVLTIWTYRANLKNILKKSDTITSTKVRFLAWNRRDFLFNSNIWIYVLQVSVVQRFVHSESLEPYVQRVSWACYKTKMSCIFIMYLTSTQTTEYRDVSWQKWINASHVPEEIVHSGWSMSRGPKVRCNFL